MDKVADKDKSPAQRSAEANPYKDGPHRKVKKKVSEGEEQPAYVVAVTKREQTSGEAPETTTYKYDPKELKAKARSLLNNPSVSSEHKKVLSEILGPEKDEK